MTEKEKIIDAIASTATKKLAAEKLGISYGTLKNRVNQYNLDKFKRSEVTDKELIKYFREGFTLTQLQTKFKLSRRYISERLHGQENYDEILDDNKFKRSQKTYIKQKHKIQKIADKQLIDEFNSGETIAALALKYKTHKRIITAALKQLLGKDGYKKQKTLIRSFKQRTAHIKRYEKEIKAIEKKLIKAKNSLEKT